MRYAILYKTHVWDDFTDRCLRRWMAAAPSADVYVLADDTRGVIGPIAHDKVVRIRNSDGIEAGVSAFDSTETFRYGNDGPLYLFLNHNETYDFHLTAEYDAVPLCNVDSIIHHAVANDLDYMALPIAEPIETWGWSATCADVYGRDVRVHNHLQCVALFSARAVRFLRSRRQQHSALFQAGQISQIPHVEAFVPTELLNNGFRWASLATVVDMGWFAAFPPFEETELTAMGDRALVHPVLAGYRYVQSRIRNEPDLHALFDPAHLLRQKIDIAGPEAVCRGLSMAFGSRRDVAGVRRCALSRLNPHFSSMDWTNLALNKPSLQSSWSRWSPGSSIAVDPHGGNDGVVDGGCGFHTACEERPWWMVDLQALVKLGKIIVFNRLDIKARASRLVVSASYDCRTWTTLYRNEPGRVFGGLDGDPLVVDVPGVPARFVRLELDGAEFLHLDEVEVYAAHPS